MKKIIVTLHNGKIKTQAVGYQGGACSKPLSDLQDSLNATLVSEEITEEGLQTEQTCSSLSENTQCA